MKRSITFPTVLFLLATCVTTTGCVTASRERRELTKRYRVVKKQLRLEQERNRKLKEKKGLCMIKLEYEHYLRGLTKEILTAEYAKAEKAYAAEESEDAYLNFAILLYIPGTGFWDNTRAMRLLNDYLTAYTDGKPENREYAQHLLMIIRERRESIKRYRVMKKQVRLEQKRSKKFKEKLEALMKIEKTIRDRQDIPEVISP